MHETLHQRVLNDKLKAHGIRVTAPVSAQHATVLTPGALMLVAKLHREFNGERVARLAARSRVQSQIEGGQWLPDFPTETAHIRAAEWRVAPIPADLRDRRVEITGPVLPAKMVINAFNSGCSCFMADFEDATAPSWFNVLEGQLNLHGAIRRTLTAKTAKKTYALNKDIATLLVRPRGWHLDERHVLVDGQPVSGSLFDAAVFMHNNAKELLSRGSGPYFYLPKLEHYREAALWNSVITRMQQCVGVPHGSVRATVLIETITAAFQMDEILHALRDHSAGLNCGRWDYIFSLIKRFRSRPDFVFPNRAQVGMDAHCMASYVKLLIHTCHKRGIHAMGGMAAQIPVRNNAVKNQAALDKVRADKRREAEAGHDGTWIAHPGLLAPAKEEFDKVMPGANQIESRATLGVASDECAVTAQDLLTVPRGTITMDGVRDNVRVCILYLEAWLRGLGCVPIAHKMEDAATAEIARAQVWQWVRHGATLADAPAGRNTVTKQLVLDAITEQSAQLQAELGRVRWRAGCFDVAVRITTFLMANTNTWTDFMTTLAYEHIVEKGLATGIAARL